MNAQSQPNSNRTAVHILILILVCAGAFFFRLGDVRLWDRDEPRNAGCALEMLERSDWIVPTFNAQLRYQKPVMLYWLIMSAYSMFGVSEFSARFWSALLGTGTVLLTYMIGRRLFHAKTGLLAGAVLATTLMFTVASRAATPDAPLIFLMTSALAIYVFNVFPNQSGSEESTWFITDWRQTVFFYFVLGLAVLTKGFAGFVVPMAIIGMFMLIARRNNPLEGVATWKPIRTIWATIHPLHFFRTLRAMNPIWGMAIVLAVAAPWYIAVSMKTEGTFARLFFLEEHIGRFSTSFENHSGGLWFYPLAIMVGFFPWSVFAWPISCEIKGAMNNDGERRKIQLLLCWVAVQVGLFSMAATKLPSYVSPCYPALALISGFALTRLAKGDLRSRPVWFRLAIAVLVGTSVLVAVGIGFSGQTFLDGSWQLGLVLMPLIIASVVSLLLFKRSPRFAIRSLAFGAIGLWMLFWGWGATTVDQTREVQRLLETAAKYDANTRVASYRCLESTWVLYGEHPIIELAVEQLTADAPTLTKHHYWERPAQVSPERFVQLAPDSVLITTRDFEQELLERLPAEFHVVERAPYFLKSKEVVLIASTAPGTNRTAQKNPYRFQSQFR
ncbi:MAG: glycosyltransferase family 39 protein [Pirellulaceae bacterium]